MALLLALASTPVSAAGNLAPRDLVLPGAQIPGDWELVDERASREGDLLTQGSRKQDSATGGL